MIRKKTINPETLQCLSSSDNVGGTDPAKNIIICFVNKIVFCNVWGYHSTTRSIDNSISIIFYFNVISFKLYASPDWNLLLTGV